MKTSKFGLLGLVLGGLLLVGAEARAVEVRYITVGTFSSTGTSTITSGNITITFEGDLEGFVNAPPASGAEFGTFVVTTSDPDNLASQNFSTGFTLEIFQSSPVDLGPVPAAVFTGTLSGNIGSASSDALVEFDAPLTQLAGLVSYQIINADDLVPGRILVAAPSAGGETTVNGRINVVPEPSALALVGLGALAPLALTLRRRVKGGTRA